MDASIMILLRKNQHGQITTLVVLHLRKWCNIDAFVYDDPNKTCLKYKAEWVSLTYAAAVGKNIDTLYTAGSHY